MDNQTARTYEIATPEWLREAATRHERQGEPIWALLYRNEAIRIEQGREAQ